MTSMRMHFYNKFSCNICVSRASSMTIQPRSRVNFISRSFPCRKYATVLSFSFASDDRACHRRISKRPIELAFTWKSLDQQILSSRYISQCEHQHFVSRKKTSNVGDLLPRRPVDKFINNVTEAVGSAIRENSNVGEVKLD